MSRAVILFVALASLLSVVLTAKAPGAKGSAKGRAAASSAWPDHYSLEGGGGLSLPLSPRGPDSFAVSYAEAYSGEGGLFAHWGPWGLGLAGTGASFAHQHVDHTSFSLAVGALVLERAFWFEDGIEEGPLVRFGAGGGTASLKSIYPGSDDWTGAALTAGAGYRFNLARHLRLDFLAASWGLLGDDKRDAVFMGQISGGLGLWW